MANSLLRTDKEIAEIYERHKKTLYRVCFAYMKNHADTEDALQETFYRLIGRGRHSRAKNMKKHGFSERQRTYARTVCGTGGAKTRTWKITRPRRRTAMSRSATPSAL